MILYQLPNNPWYNFLKTTGLPVFERQMAENQHFKKSCNSPNKHRQFGLPSLKLDCPSKSKPTGLYNTLKNS